MLSPTFLHGQSQIRIQQIQVDPRPAGNFKGFELIGLIHDTQYSRILAHGKEFISEV